MLQLLARAGTTPSGKICTSQMIRDAVSTWPDVAKAPLSLNDHPRGLSLKAGDITALKANDDFTELYGEVNLNQHVAPAVADGFFNDRSAGFGKRPNDGKYYLHHVALLGGVPPAIKNLPSLVALDSLEPVQFADGQDVEEIEFAEPITYVAIARFMRAMRDATIESDGLERADSLYPEWYIETVERAGREQVTDTGSTFSETQEGDEMSTPNNQNQNTQTSGNEPVNPAPGVPPPADEGQGTAQFSETQFTQMQKRLEQMQRQQRKAENDAIRSALAGRMPKASIDRVIAFADTLPDDLVEFSEGSEAVSPRQELAAIFAELPEMVRSGVMEFTDAQPKDTAVQQAYSKF